MADKKRPFLTDVKTLRARGRLRGGGWFVGQARGKMLRRAAIKTNSADEGRRL